MAQLWDRGVEINPSGFSSEIRTQGSPDITATSPDAKGNRETLFSSPFKSISTFADQKGEEVCKQKDLIRIRSPAESLPPPGSLVG